MKKVLLVAVSVLLVCTSCVTKKKYLLAENGRLEAIARGDDLQNQLVNCRDNNDGLTSRLASLERDTTGHGQEHPQLSKHAQHQHDGAGKIEFTPEPEDERTG